MSNIDFETKNEINVTEVGTFKKTVFAKVDHLPKCAKCGKEMYEDETCYFCMQALRFFCMDCVAKQIDVCNEFINGFQNHSDRLVRIKLI